MKARRFVGGLFDFQRVALLATYSIYLTRGLAARYRQRCSIQQNLQHTRQAMMEHAVIIVGGGPTG
jgi:hypothetical protein